MKTALYLFLLYGYYKQLTSLTADQRHVCSRNVSSVAIKVNAVTEPYQKCTQTWCPSVWSFFRCTNCYTLYRQGYKEEPIRQTSTEYYCCQGYIESNGRCVVHCSKGCVNGACVDPNVCTCASGWTGERCDKPKEQKRSRKNCEDSC